MCTNCSYRGSPAVVSSPLRFLWQAAGYESLSSHQTCSHGCCFTPCGLPANSAAATPSYSCRSSVPACFCRLFLPPAPPRSEPLPFYIPGPGRAGSQQAAPGGRGSRAPLPCQGRPGPGPGPRAPWRRLAGGFPGLPALVVAWGQPLRVLLPLCEPSRSWAEAGSGARSRNLELIEA